MTAEQAISWLTLKPKDLPVFVLIASDPFASVALTAWITEAKAAQISPEKVSGARAVQKQFWDYPYKKLPG